MTSRLLQALFTLWLLVTVVFLTVQFAPGDPTLHLALHPDLPPAARQVQIERLGLDQPVHVQYGRYLAGLLVGDLGVSATLYPRDVGAVIAQRLPRTIALLGLATLAAFGIGLVAGRWAAWRRGTPADTGSTVVAVFLHTAFPPWVALMAIWVFAFELGWFPSGRFLTPSVWRDAPWSSTQVFAHLFAGATMLAAALAVVWVVASGVDRPRVRRVARTAGIVVVLAIATAVSVLHPMRTLAANILWHTALPTFTLTVLAFGATMLLTRTSMLETLEQDHVLVARARGLPERVVRRDHVARPAMNPIVASLVLSLAGLVTGSIVFEAVFSWPGLGLTFVDAAIGGDVPLATGIVLTYGIMLLVAHVALDLVQVRIDPRLRARASVGR